MLLWTQPNGTISEGTSILSNQQEGGSAFGYASGSEMALTCTCCTCYDWAISLVCWRDTPCEDGSQEACSQDIDLLHDEACEDELPYDSAKIKGVYIGTVIDNIRWVDFNATFSGTAIFTAFVDAKAVNEPEEYEVDSNDTFTWGTDAFRETLSEGWHRIRVVVKCEDVEGNKTVFERCRCIFVFDENDSGWPSQTIEMRDLVLVPFVASEVCIDENRELVRLKGPFASREDARRVLEGDEWRDFIEAYAQSCPCQITCGPGDDAMNESVSDGFDGWLGSGGGSGGGFTIWDCERDMEWTIENNSSNVTISLRVWISETESGAVIWNGSGIAFIPRCTKVAFYAIAGSGGGTATVNVYVEEDGATSECVLSDPESIYFEAEWDYNYVSKEGVPSTSEELIDYLESVAV